MQWLEKDFINYLDEWKESANGREDLSESEKQKLCLSRETLEGLHFTSMHAFFHGINFNHMLLLYLTQLTIGSFAIVYNIVHYCTLL